MIINIEDYNDFAPVFREGTYNKKIPESFELDEEILVVTADDEDIGVNKEISYSIVDDEGIIQSS